MRPASTFVVVNRVETSVESIVDCFCALRASNPGVLVVLVVKIRQEVNEDTRFGDARQAPDMRYLTYSITYLGTLSTHQLWARYRPSLKVSSLLLGALASGSSPRVNATELKARLAYEKRFNGDF